ncbi:unnamed protein product [Haemonchus placei]|uniref:Uncharacterized protein n=1 Tax=Haemonchus placei TaxID=6290 RepID=A0A0N4W913_HAEPC|nr:unnamed protein product [Haemonchus placei]
MDADDLYDSADDDIDGQFLLDLCYFLVLNVSDYIRIIKFDR